jgi:hypothetical protein
MYGDEIPQIYILLKSLNNITSILKSLPGATFVASRDGMDLIRTNKHLDTYQAIISLAKQGAQFEKISGNQFIVISTVGVYGVSPKNNNLALIFSQQNTEDNTTRYV